jgi:DMSO/TMAO reductase YedYZ molybdopterin-dependent catalytic subunit
VKSLSGVLASAFIVLALSGCSAATADPSASSSLDTTDYQITHFAVDPPKQSDIVLRASGSTYTHFTMGQLDAMATQKQTLFERFSDKTETFRGISLADLFAVTGIKHSDRLVFFASDDYRYIDTAENMIKNDGILAVAMNGKPIPADQGGPIRIVFPDKTRYAGISEPWVWSLVRISKAG